MRYLLLCFFLAVFIVACTGTDKQSYLPGYSGKFGEVIAVCTKSQWNGNTGTAIRHVLESPQYGLPQDEPLFDVVQVSPKSFKKVLSTHRNVLHINISDTVKKNGFVFKKSRYARGQMFIGIKGKNSLVADSIIAAKKNAIVSLFQRTELNRLISRNKKRGPGEVEKKVAQKFDLGLILQKDAYIALEDSNFMWIRLEHERPVGGYKHQVMQGVLIYRTEYKNRNDFQDKRLFNLKDSLNKQFIAGPSPGSYVTTDYGFVPPQVTGIELAGQYAKEVKGLWKMENNFMGGPFVSVVTTHPEKDFFYYLEGFVYAPQFDKREYLREVEAMVKSISFKTVS